MQEQIKIQALYDLENTLAKPLLQRYTYPWEALSQIGEFIKELGKTLSQDEYEQKADDIWIAKSATIYSNCDITGPCIIGKNTQIRPNAFIRGNVFVGDYCVVGNSTELKNVILFDYVQVPHYNYVGDSILGYRSHMGAGSITSNVKADKTPVSVKGEEIEINTGLKKFGAMLGDFVEIGCNAVLNPGTIVGKHTNVYPLSMVRGVIPPNSIYKGKDEVVKKE